MSTLRFVCCVISVVLITGCSGPARKDAVPDSLTSRASIPGFDGIRYRVGIDVDELRDDAIDSFYRETAFREASGQKGKLPPVSYLAVSGGGDYGAFGAGLLNGWSAAGDRPEFKLVTGVSTGALIAPFAFLGPAYDESLKRFYTTLSPSDIAEKRFITAALTSDALADNTPLWKIVEREITRDFLDAVAKEYAKGRLLLIATVDLDARQAVLWNMTKIAASTNPGALHLFRSVLIASAAIPGAFPPVMIDVVADGSTYQEMHVDGGAMSQVFVYPPSIKLKELSSKYRVERERRAYVILNARVDIEWAQVDRRTMSIVGRAISSLIQSQGLGDLYRIYLEALRDNVDFNLAHIPSEFDAPHREEFDTEFMRALFQKGYDMASHGYPWKKRPPGL